MNEVAAGVLQELKRVLLKYWPSLCNCLEMLCKHNIFLEPKSLPACNSQVGRSRTFLALCGSGPALKARRRSFYGSISPLEYIYIKPQPLSP